MYTGVTSDLHRRVWEHRNGIRSGFASKYNVTKLVYLEEFAHIEDAIAWEKMVKGRSRAWKISLIDANNPRWNDLAWNWFDG